MSSSQNTWPFVINLGNSIIGVSVLAMPFCFKQCGIVLGTVLLLCSAWMTQISCKLLMKAALSSKKRSYEFLAHHTFGGAGKLAVEVSIIGLLLGTCVAFHVIIGDLGPNIISKITGLQNTPQLRTSLMVFLGLCVALPLGLLRNIESLSNVSAISIGFYSLFVLHVLFIAIPYIWSGMWVSRIELWRMTGVFQCLPIFALAFACQTQLFVMYDALPEPSLSKMNSIVNNAISLCTVMYLLVGFFGYIAFSDTNLGGDVLMSFKPNIISESIKLGFTLSVALSFPLIIFPMRASINTLLFSQTSLHENISGSSIIPPMRFRIITVCVVVGTLIVGILVPNVEFVLGLTGSTMGTMISFIFPAVMFISVTSTKSDGKPTAQLVLFIGVTVLLASTYTTLRSQDQKQPIVNMDPIVPANPANVLGKDDVIAKPDLLLKDIAPPDIDTKKAADAMKGDSIKDIKPAGGKRQEPPEPKEPKEVEKKNVEKIDAGNDEVKQQESKVKVDVKVPEDKVQRNTAIVKRDSESDKIQKDKIQKLEVAEEKQQVLLNKLEQQQKQQQELIKEQKELIQELKHHKEEAHPDQVEKVAQEVIDKLAASQLQQKNQDAPAGKILNNLPVLAGGQHSAPQNVQEAQNQSPKQAEQKLDNQPHPREQDKLQKLPDKEVSRTTATALSDVKVIRKEREVRQPSKMSVNEHGATVKTENNLNQVSWTNDIKRPNDKVKQILESNSNLNPKIKAGVAAGNALASLKGNIAGKVDTNAAALVRSDMKK